MTAGTRVVARDRVGERHTERGVVVEVSERAPFALVRFDCGCREYLPVDVLRRERATPPEACDVEGCRAPRWDGAYCSNHRDTRGVDVTARPAPSPAGESFEPSVGSAPEDMPEGNPFSRAAPSVDAIDDRGERDGGGAGTTERRPAPPASSRPTPAHPARPRKKREAYWTKERIVAALIAEAAETKKTPTSEGWKYADPDGKRPTRNTVEKVFSGGERGARGWMRALASAGLTPDPRGWTREAIIEAIRAHAKANAGEPPSSIEWTKAKPGVHPTSTTVTVQFGTWSAAIRAAGFEPRRPGVRRGTRRTTTPNREAST